MQLIFRHIGQTNNKYALEILKKNSFVGVEVGGGGGWGASKFLSDMSDGPTDFV